MRLRVVAPILLALAAVVGLVLGAVLPGSGRGVVAGQPSGGGQPGDGATPGTSDNAAVTPSSSNGSVADTNAKQPLLPVTKLKKGQKPPQFVIVSFDGACKDELFKHYLETAKRNDARFTFFLSALCILPESDRFKYDPPLKPAGTSAIGFGEPSFIPDRIRNLTTAYNAGHEIGTHANGHFCGPGGVGEWTSDQWRSEMKQFNSFVDNWRTNLGSPLADGVPPLPFNSSVIQGIRTPCLEGKRSAMYPVFADLGYKYDASNDGELRWPSKNKYGLWEFPLQNIKVVGYGRSNLSMDYNFLCTQNNCSEKSDQATSDRIQSSTKDSFDLALKDVCKGNRAPLFIGNHFNTWVNSAYRNALTDFIDGAKDVCPDVTFISNMDLVRWLEGQDPAVLSALRERGSQQQ